MKYLLLIPILTLFLFSCSPEDGQDGLMGPQGAQGEQGIPGVDGQDGEQGQQGPQGEQGEVGTANVIYSEWFPSEFSDNIVGTSETFSISAPDLTQEIVDNGLILAYGKYIVPITSVEQIAQLPYSVFFLNQHYFYIVTTNPSNSFVHFEVTSIDGSPVGTPWFDEYRYIIVPGGNPVSGKSNVLDYTKMSYEELLAHFKIPK